MGSFLWLIRKAKELWGWWAFISGFTAAGAFVIAWLSTTWVWYWQTFNWAGVAFAFLVAWLVIALGVFLIGIGVARWRIGVRPDEPKMGNGISRLDPNASDDPEAEATDKQAYREILDFALDKVIPACQAQIEAQEAVISQICGTAQVAALASIGLRHSANYKMSEFWSNFERLQSGLTESPGPIIKFEAIIDCIAGLEAGSYKKFCEQLDEIANAADINPKANAKLLPIWFEWAQSHNALVNAYNTIKRDPRFGKLLRPARSSRWGDPISALTT
jgi:hypothetical protein